MKNGEGRKTRKMKINRAISCLLVYVMCLFVCLNARTCHMRHMNYVTVGEREKRTTEGITFGGGDSRFGARFICQRSSGENIFTYVTIIHRSGRRQTREAAVTHRLTGHSKRRMLIDVVELLSLELLLLW